MKFTRVLLAVLILGCCLPAFANDLHQVKIEHTFNFVRVFLTDLSATEPFIQIEKLPELAPSRISHERHTRSASFRPFVLLLDQVCDGVVDLKIGPHAFPKVRAECEMGFRVNHSAKPDVENGMPLFQRIEIQLHDALKHSSVLKRREFKINRVIIRRMGNTNLQIAFRDHFYESGKDFRFNTPFVW